MKARHGLLGKMKLANKNKLTVQKRLVDMAVAMRELPQVECKIKHCFTDGLYSRQMTIPKDTVIISKLHKTEHQFVMSKGKMLVWNEGEKVKEISAPFAGITKPGTMRMAVILEDVVWTTFHATKMKDPEKIERRITIDPIEEAKCLSV